MHRRAQRLAPKLALLALRVVAAVLAFGAVERAPAAMVQEAAHAASLARAGSSRLAKCSPANAAIGRCSPVQSNDSLRSAFATIAGPALPVSSELTIAPAVASFLVFDEKTTEAPGRTTIVAYDARGPPV